MQVVKWLSSGKLVAIKPDIQVDGSSSDDGSSVGSERGDASLEIMKRTRKLWAAFRI